MQGYLDSGTGTAFCSKVRRVESIVVFEDSDPNYIVSNANAAGTNRYAIRFVDGTYSEFDAPTVGGSLQECRTVQGATIGELTCVG